MIKNYITVDGHKYKLVSDVGNEVIEGTIGHSWSTIYLKGKINGHEANIAVSDNNTADIRHRGWDLTADELRDFILFLEEVVEKLEDGEEEDDDE